MSRLIESRSDETQRKDDQHLRGNNQREPDATERRPIHSFVIRTSG
jgi:hypothetical protein